VDALVSAVVETGTPRLRKTASKPVQVLLFKAGANKLQVLFWSPSPVMACYPVALGLQKTIFRCRQSSARFA
jgi:hypothetical protein